MQGRVINNTKVGSLPDGVVEAEGFLWVANTADDEVTRIDAATFSSMDAIPVGAGPTSITCGVRSRLGRQQRRPHGFADQCLDG